MKENFSFQKEKRKKKMKINFSFFKKKESFCVFVWDMCAKIYVLVTFLAAKWY